MLQSFFFIQNFNGVEPTVELDLNLIDGIKETKEFCGIETAQNTVATMPDDVENIKSMKIMPPYNRLSIPNGSENEMQPATEIKGFTKDNMKRITCLDCGKLFMAKNSYNYHKRM